MVSCGPTWVYSALLLHKGQPKFHCYPELWKLFCRVELPQHTSKCLDPQLPVVLRVEGMWVDPGASKPCLWVWGGVEGALFGWFKGFKGYPPSLNPHSNRIILDVFLTLEPYFWAPRPPPPPPPNAYDSPGSLLLPALA